MKCILSMEMQRIRERGRNERSKFCNKMDTISLSLWVKLSNLFTLVNTVCKTNE